MSHALDRLIQEAWSKGYAEGLAEVREEGRIEGKAEALVRILRNRFDNVAGSLVDLVSQQKDCAVLDGWVTLALQAPSPEAFERVMDGWRIPEVRNALDCLIREGWFEGEAKGRAEALAYAIRKVLEHRFGELGRSLADRVSRESSQWTLERWLRLALCTSSLAAFRRAAAATRPPSPDR